MSKRIWVICLILACGGALGAKAQTLRMHFKSDVNTPNGWNLSGGAGKWERSGPAPGERSLSVTGDGFDSNTWEYPLPPLTPMGDYRFTFRMRCSEGSAGGCAVSGPSFCNHDFLPTTKWKTYSFIFTAPPAFSQATLRLGQWQLKGTVYFADASLEPVTAVNTVVKVNGKPFIMGDGERLTGDSYIFQPGLGGDNINGSRSLESFTATFNSNRWVFGDGQTVTYHLGNPFSFRDGIVTVDMNYHIGGECLVQVSHSGSDWSTIGTLNGVGQRSFSVPFASPDTPDFRMRLKAAPDPAHSEAPVNFQIDEGVFTCRVIGKTPVCAGRSLYLAGVQPNWGDVAYALTNSDLLIQVKPKSAALMRRMKAEIRFTKSGTLSSSHALTFRKIAAGVYQAAAEMNSFPAGDSEMIIALKPEEHGATEYMAQTSLYTPDYYAGVFGKRLQAPKGCLLWWCVGTRKVSLTREAPQASSAAITFAAARREHQAMQLIVVPQKAGAMTMRVTDLFGPRGAVIPSSAISLREVAYVPITTPTDNIGLAGEWPDPLPPLPTVWHPVPHSNNPIWITLNVPGNARAGDYTGSILLQSSNGWRAKAPIRCHVWNFSLPVHTALRSGFGVDPGAIQQYFHIKSKGALEKEWELFMKAFAKNGINPYNPMSLHPYEMNLDKSSSPGEIKINFVGFDRDARKYINGLGFNAFTIAIPGMGGGRYPNYDEGSLYGYAAGTPQYEDLMAQAGKIIQNHLKANGWLRKAYIYWYDEPSPSDYPFVARGMKRLERIVPDIKRIMTVAITPQLYGDVNLWCPLTPNFSFEASQARQKLGEEVWWYVCTGPKAPYCGEFIDHPAIEMRMWLWQTWKYHVNGVLIWDTTYWNSPYHSKNGPLQNPWKDPMSYVSDSQGIWGNGDGRFFYPPQDYATNDMEQIVPPVPSLRWEMLGEGVEDWEYLHLLQSLVNKLKSPAERAKYMPLLKVPDSICRDMTHFTDNPDLIYARRAQIAKAIETLER